MGAHHNEGMWGVFVPQGDWVERALCAETDPELFFPEKGGSTREAKAVCRACEVRTECLQYALDTGERFGIFGGLSERERRHLRIGRNVEHTCVWCGETFTTGPDTPRKFCTTRCRGAWQSDAHRAAREVA